MTMQTTITAAAMLVFAFITAPAALAQTPETNMPWCGDVDGAKECVYATLEECERWMRPEGQMCMPNPRGTELD